MSIKNPSARAPGARLAIVAAQRPADLRGEAH
jgi:hypothetical protein